MAFDLQIPVDGFCTLGVWGRFFGQETRMEFAYENTTADVISLVTEAVPFFISQHLSSLRTLITQDWEAYNIRADAYDEIGTALGFRDVSLSAFGAVGPPTAPPMVAMVLRRRVGTIGRANRGRVYLPAVPLSGTNFGALVPAYAALAVQACLDLGQPLNDEAAPPSNLLSPLLLKRGPTGVILSRQLVSFWNFNQYVRSQRRRQIGVGI